jgi:hypothetical protein
MSRTLDNGGEMKGKRIIVAVCLAAQTAMCLYCSLMAFLLSIWFVDDSVAVQMQASDWMRVGMMRFGQSLIVAAIVAALMFAWNRYILRLSVRVARWLALPAFLLIVFSSLAGVVRFVWTRPFM